MTENQQALIDHLSTVSGMFTGLKAQGFKYNSVEEVVLKEGQFFNPQPLPVEYEQGTQRECFKNSYDLAISTDLTYAEGYAVPDFVFLPVHHAWGIDADGNVVDPTWDRPGVVYLGIPITLKFLIERALDTKVYGIFGCGSPRSLESLLRKGLPSHAKKS